MKILLVLIMLVLSAGCGRSGPGDEEGLTEIGKERQRGIFWQFAKPRIQLDPIEEEEFPGVISPVKGEGD